MDMNGGKHNEAKWTGASKMNGGKNLMRAVGMAGKNGSRHTARRTGTAGKHSQRILRPAQASQQTNGPQLAGRAAKTTAADDLACRRAGKWGECSGIGTQEGGLRPT